MSTIKGVAGKSSLAAPHNLIPTCKTSDEGKEKAIICINPIERINFKGGRWEFSQRRNPTFPHKKKKEKEKTSNVPKRGSVKTGREEEVDWTEPNLNRAMDEWGVLEMIKYRNPTKFIRKMAMSCHGNPSINDAGLYTEGQAYIYGISVLNQWGNSKKVSNLKEAWRWM